MLLEHIRRSVPDVWASLVVAIFFMYGHGSPERTQQILHDHGIQETLVDIKQRRTSQSWSSLVPAFPYSYYHSFGRHMRMINSLSPLGLALGPALGPL
jgi:hypothetical protein